MLGWGLGALRGSDQVLVHTATFYWCGVLASSTMRTLVSAGRGPLEGFGELIQFFDILGDKVLIHSAPFFSAGSWQT